jgi:hypothetical protein
MLRISGLYNSSYLQARTNVTSIRQSYCYLHKLSLQLQLIYTRGVYSTMASASLSASLSLPSGNTLTVPTGLFINNEFVSSVTGDTLMYAYAYALHFLIIVLTHRHIEGL